MSKPTPFGRIVVHSFSRFFHDHFELEFRVRKLAKNGLKLVSNTQEMGDDPMHVMMRQLMVSGAQMQFWLFRRNLHMFRPCQLHCANQKSPELSCKNTLYLLVIVRSFLNAHPQSRFLLPCT